MPLMREWVEIHVEEGLLIHVVRELLALAVNPNQVEVTNGTAGRVILAEVHLAEAWYEGRSIQPEQVADSGVEVSASGPEVVAAANVESPPLVTPEIQLPTELMSSSKIVAPAEKVEKVEPSKSAPVTVPAPAKRVPVVKPSASPDGEES